MESRNKLLLPQHLIQNVFNTTSFPGLFPSRGEGGGGGGGAGEMARRKFSRTPVLENFRRAISPAPD